MFESFASSVNIAGDCDIKIDTQSYGQCGLQFTPTMVIFMQGTGCTPDGSIGNEDGEWNESFGDFDSICYDTPNLINTLFNS